jgi:hypothetical protein
MPETPEEYFDEIVGSRPSEENPNPELALVDGLDFDRGSDGDGPSASGSKFRTGLPPGYQGGWYYAVRIVINGTGALGKVVGTAQVLICMYQIAVPSSASGSHDAWLMNATKLVVRHELAQLVARLRQLALEQVRNAGLEAVVEDEQAGGCGGHTGASGSRGPAGGRGAGRGGRGGGRGTRSAL